LSKNGVLTVFFKAAGLSFAMYCPIASKLENVPPDLAVHLNGGPSLSVTSGADFNRRGVAQASDVFHDRERFGPPNQAGDSAATTRTAARDFSVFMAMSLFFC
jgi:hypothetical protein